MDELAKEVARDVREIKDQILELVKQGAVMNQTLIEHERRSTNLEQRLKPIEDTHVFLGKFAGVVITLSGVIGALLSLSKYLK